MINPDLIKAGKIAKEAIQLGFSLIKKRGCISKKDVDTEIEKFIRDNNCSPSLKGYKPPFVDKTYQHATCISTNWQVVHTPPNDEVIKVEKDLIKIDLVVNCNGWHADSARTWSANSDYFEIIKSGMEVLNAGLAVIKSGSYVRDFGEEIEKQAQIRNLHPIKQLCGHGINPGVHEEPSIRNFYDPMDYSTFEVGKCFAVEPILAKGIYPYNINHDGDWIIWYPLYSIHFEDTIIICENEVINLTN